MENQDLKRRSPRYGRAAFPTDWTITARIEPMLYDLPIDSWHDYAFDRFVIPLGSRVTVYEHFAHRVAAIVFTVNNVPRIFFGLHSASFSLHSDRAIAQLSYEELLMAEDLAKQEQLKQISAAKQEE